MAKLYTKNTWQDEVLSGNERYNVLEDGGASIHSNIQIALATAVAQAGTPATAARLNNIENGVDAVDTLLDTANIALGMLLTGWIAGAGTWTYASATTFTVAGNVTAFFTPGTKLRLTQTTTKYFYVLSSSYSAPNTTITITGGTDYTLANAAITAPAYSYMSNPQGFPHWFNFLATVSGTGGSAGAFAEGLVYQKFRIDGKVFFADISKRINSIGSWTGDIRMAMPPGITLSGAGRYGAWVGGVWGNTSLAPKAYAQIVETYVQFPKLWAGGLLQGVDMVTNDHIVLRFFAEFS